jgi:hypothetical protein
MFSEELNRIVRNQISDSTTFWAGKPKLNEKELDAVAEFAKKKGEALDKALAGETSLESMYQAALNKAK